MKLTLNLSVGLLEHDTGNGDTGYHTLVRLANSMGPESINSKVL